MDRQLSTTWSITARTEQDGCRNASTVLPGPVETIKQGSISSNIQNNTLKTEICHCSQSTITGEWNLNCHAQSIWSFCCKMFLFSTLKGKESWNPGNDQAISSGRLFWTTFMWWSLDDPWLSSQVLLPDMPKNMEVDGFFRPWRTPSMCLTWLRTL